MDNRIDSSSPVANAARGAFDTTAGTSIRHDAIRPEPNAPTLTQRYAQTYSRPRRLTTRRAGRTHLRRSPSTVSESIVFGASRAFETPCQGFRPAALASPSGLGAQPN